jgi:tetratricopeptide (TPR) repeat protein
MVVWPTWVMSVLIFLVTLIAYFPALKGGFIWDDAGHVTRPDLQSFSGLVRIWTEIGATQQYYPVLHSAFWIEHGLWGDSALGYHLINVLLHATAASQLGLLLMRLRVPGAWIAAFIFALHPVAVESVAWISEQKNTLSTVFYLAAALGYLRYSQQRSRGNYVIATLRFTVAVLTKSVAATLPAALLVMIWWKRGRIEWQRDVRPLLPWFALALGMGIVTANFEHRLIGAQGADFALNYVDRAILAGRILWFYAGKVIWPDNLIFIYPHWSIDSGQAAQWIYLLGALALAAGLWAWRQRDRGPLAATLFFAGTLFPALGFVNVFPFLFSYVADHFQYVAMIGLIVLIATGIMLALERMPYWAGRLLVVGLLLGLGTLTRAQSGMYRDVVTLYQTTIDRNPTCWMAYNNLAEVLAQSGKPAEAVPLLEQALKLRPNFAEAENNLGDDLRLLGRAAEAIPHLQRALLLNPRIAEVHNSLGIAYMMLGQTPAGMASFEAALKIRPNFSRARFNLGLALASSGRSAEAIPHFEYAVRIDPNYGEAELNLGIALTLTQRQAEAWPHFERALQLDPDSPYVHNNYGRALANAGRFDEAMAHYRTALEQDPTFAEAHLNLALALRQTGKTAEAEQHYREALRLNPKLLGGR